MEPNESTTSYDDLTQVITALSFWSKESMQKFLESGLPSDIKQMVSMPSIDFEIFRIEDTYRFLIDNFRSSSPASIHNQSKVTLSQALKLFEFAPRDRIEWTNFFRVMSALGQRSNFFAIRGVNFEERDSIRVLMGLSPINPVYKNDKGKEVVFRKTGHCNIWEKPPAGYRYAYIHEVPVGTIEVIDSFVVVHRNSGHYNWKKLSIVDGDIRTGDIDAAMFFHNNVLYVPLVKVE